MLIIASLTTMPNRINLIRPVLDAIRKQKVKVHHIEINVPYKCIRTEEDYVIPQWLEEYPDLEIYRTEDYGAITKVAPTLLRHKDEEVYIWSVDDDVKYPSNTLEGLIKKHDPSIKRILAYSVGSITTRGFQGSSSNEGYDMVLEGVGSVLYPLDCIKDDFLSYVEKTSSIPDCRVSDDIILSNYFEGQGIRIFRCPDLAKLKIASVLLPYYKDQTATHLQTGGHANRYVRVLHHLQSLGLLYWKNIFANNNVCRERIIPKTNKSIFKPTPKSTSMSTPTTTPIPTSIPMSTDMPIHKNVFSSSYGAQGGKRFCG